MLHPVNFHVPDRLDEQRLIRDLAARYRVNKARGKQEVVAFYDTFDWRLYHRSLVLYLSGNRLVLRRLFDSSVLRSGKIASPPVLAGDLPAGELKKHLAPIIKVRALVKLVEVCSRTRPYRMVNREGKTAVRMTFEEIRLCRGGDMPVLATSLRVQPGEISPRSFRNLKTRLEGAGCTASRKEDIFLEALKTVNKTPGDYSTKVNIPLTPDMRSDEAMRIILRFLLRVIRINEAQIEKDLDTEFLHDFRVAIRRTRSALSQVKTVFPEEITVRFKKDFSFAGRISNELRDLDVYLLNEERYKAMLPAALRDDIEPLFVDLRERRSGAFREVNRTLRSVKYRQIVERWDRFLNEPRQESPAATDAGLPILDLAQKKIHKKYRRIVKDGTLILENANDERLHLLRIHCKELRYLLEFFSGLYPPEQFQGFIGNLKKLQDMLGDFNDFSVQERYLRNIAGELRAAGRQSDKTISAIDLLVALLERKKGKVKDTFAKTFTEFASPENRREFRVRARIPPRSRG